jgi:hypothetical protein
MVIRGSGIAAFAALGAATIWGLLVSTKLLGKLVKAKPLTWFHESLGIAALVATAVHVAVLSMHDYLDFSWAEILVPGVSDWRSGAVALGVVAWYCTSARRPGGSSTSPARECSSLPSSTASRPGQTLGHL